MKSRGMFKIIGSIVILFIIGFLVFYFMNKDANETSQDNETDNVSENLNNAIKITELAFTPNAITIKAGESVTWINERDDKSWPASAMHPTHTVYTGADYSEEGSYMGSKACVSEGKAKEGAFDPCKGLANGESWTFTFNEKGVWYYHDHLHPGMSGSVRVE